MEREREGRGMEREGEREEGRGTVHSACSFVRKSE